ncbi:Ubiquitin fusion degradation protein UFD1 [Ascosphaera apis ARSEF 7405]|uniref:Ubiquitin fusion degradation protein UFD1 n=1 Tax=Ascosphaera apis ARSEF 7405 TaxID=392613 RepID=A0A168DWZ9_9EURO|nr:Ubiquitin fusion degradation protein UFD1 [Ascosphaera apis ARSEF 7405]
MVEADTLKWSRQYAVVQSDRTSRLTGDKILLPQSALEQLLASVPAIISNGHSYNRFGRPADSTSLERNRQLPHPLTFRLVNPDNGRVVYAGVQEFSADEDTIGLSTFLRQSLRIEATSSTTTSVVTIHAKPIPKGTFVSLRPLDAGYDTEDWKALLERHLRHNYTTLTSGEVLTIPSGLGHDFHFLVDNVKPEGEAICVVDTDLVVDLEPLNEEQARESLKRREQKALETEQRRQGGKGGELSVGKICQGAIAMGTYVDYELKDWDHTKALDIVPDSEKGAQISILISPFSPRHRARPRLDEHVLGYFPGNMPSTIHIEPTNIALEDAAEVYLSVYASSQTETEKGKEALLSYSIQVQNPANSTDSDGDDEDVEGHGSDEVQCTNCRQWVPQRTLFLHESFCLRNNISCKICGDIFKKGSPEWEEHWHCPHDNFKGDSKWSELNHQDIFHTPRACVKCSFRAENYPQLAQHRTTACPEKLILCQFCHLVVPQQGDSDPDINDPEVLLSGLTPHELIDGGRTTECHLCNKILRLRDMATHLRHHDINRLSREPPRICVNPNCCRVVLAARNRGTPVTLDNERLGLCSSCFGPLHAPVYDPEGKALRRRVERKYLTQMLKGCAQAWCRNMYCRTGRTNNKLENAQLPAKDIMTLSPTMTKGMICPGSWQL